VNGDDEVIQLSNELARAGANAPARPDRCWINHWRWLAIVAGILASSGTAPARENPNLWSVEAVFRHVPPLLHEHAGRLPMITWPSFCQGTNDAAFERGEPLPPEVYRELERRGLTQRLRLSTNYVSMAVAMQAAGAKVVFVEGWALNGPYELGPDPLHKLPAGFKPAAADRHYACPTLTEGWAKKADEIRATLRAYKSAGVKVSGVWLDWEIEPLDWSPGRWEQARACARCQSLLPRGTLDSAQNYSAFIQDFRAALFSAYVAAPALEVYPGIPVTDWGAVVSTPDIPTLSYWGNRRLSPRDLGLFTAANPVAYGNTIYYEFHWTTNWGYPLDVPHMDRLYTHVMLSQVSLNAANMKRSVPWKFCIPWVCRYCPDLEDEKVPILSRERYREILRHIWLRGADSMQIFNEPRPKHPEIYLEELEDAVAVYDEVLAYRLFLEHGVLMNTTIPKVTDNGAIWSGLRLENEALIRGFTQNAKPVSFTITPWSDGPAVELTAPPRGQTWRLVRDGGKIKTVKMP